MPLQLILKISLRYLASNRYKYLPSFLAFISFFGIFLSTATLVIVMSVMTGFKSEFINTIIGIRPHIKIERLGGAEINNYKQILDSSAIQSLRQFDEVELAYPAISGEAMITDPRTSRMAGAIIYAISPKDFDSRKMLANSIVSGNFSGLMLGSDLANALNVDVGDQISVILPELRTTIFGSIPVHKTYTISGIFSVKMFQHDSTTAILPLEQGQTLFGTSKDSAKTIELILKTPQSAQVISMQLANTLPPGFAISDWKSESIGFIRAIETQTNVMFFILLLFEILASFIIFSGISTMVNSKRRSIAILKTLGFSSTQVFNIFFISGSLILLLAILLGALCGIYFALNIETIKNYLEQITGNTIFDGAYYFLSYIPSKVDLATIVRIIILCFTLGIIAIAIPTFRTLKIKISEVLKWE